MVVCQARRATVIPNSSTGFRFKRTVGCPMVMPVSFVKPRPPDYLEDEGSDPLIPCQL